MTDGWKTKPLGELCDVIDSMRKPITKRDRIAGIYPYYGASGVLGYVDGYLFDEKLVLVGEDGAKWGSGENTAFAVEGKIWVNNHAHVLRPDRSKVLDNWLIYFLNHSDLSKFVSGLTVPKLNQGNLREIPIPLAPLPEQARIIRILDEALESIAAANSNTGKNLQNARSLFDGQLHAIFTHFGQGWITKSIGDVCILRSGTTLPKSIERTSGEIPYLKVADMNIPENLNGITCSSRYVEEADVNASNLLPAGTTIFPKRGGAILTNKKRFTSRVICADLNIMGVTPKPGLLPEFLFKYFLHLDLREINNGSSIPQINNYSIEPLRITFPESITEQKEIVAKLDALLETTRKLESIYNQKRGKLVALKKSLLARSFSGGL